MKKALNDIFCIFRIHLARLRAEAGPFLLAAIVFPIAMYLFASGIALQNGSETLPNRTRLQFLAASIVFSLSLTSISWFGYLLLENRFTGRLKLFATLPIAPSSYVLGVLIFVLVQAGVGTTSMLTAAWYLGADIQFGGARGILGLTATIFLTVLSLSGLSLIIASRVRSFSEGSLMTDAFGAGLVLLAPIYYPMEALPRALAWSSIILPTRYAYQAVNGILTGGGVMWSELSMLGVMAIATLSIGFWQMKWREK